MADPISMLAIAGATLGAVGGLVKGEQQARAAEFNAAELAGQAAFTRERTQVEEERFRRLARKERGAFVTAAGSSLAFGGSAADILEDAVINQELDALNIRLQGKLQERALISGVAQQKQRAKDIRFGAALGVGTSLLKSVGTGGSAPTPAGAGFGSSQGIPTTRGGAALNF